MGRRPRRATTRSSTASPPRLPPRTLALATWKQLLDNGSMQDGDDNLRATARNAVARVSQAVLDALRRHRDADR